VLNPEDEDDSDDSKKLNSIDAEFRESTKAMGEHGAH